MSKPNTGESSLAQQQWSEFRTSTDGDLDTNYSNRINGSPYGCNFAS